MSVVYKAEDGELGRFVASSCPRTGAERQRKESRRFPCSLNRDSDYLTSRVHTTAAIGIFQSVIAAP